MRDSWLEQNLEYLFRLRAHWQLGRRAGDRIVQIARPAKHHPKDHKLLGRTLRTFGLEKRSRLSVFDPPELLLEQLEALRPDIVIGFASVLQRVGQVLGATGAPQLRPRFLLTEAEVLTPAMRARIEGDWRAPLFETYGCHEFNLLAWQCPTGEALHTCDDSVVIEVLKDGRPVAPGGRGEVVATALHLYAMPFIRYRLGDVVTRGPAECGCGQPFSTIRSIQGRMRDFFALPGGRWIPPSEFIDGMRPDAQHWIGQFQFIQEREDRIVMRLVPMPDARPERIAAYERYLAGALGSRSKRGSSGSRRSRTAPAASSTCSAPWCAPTMTVSTGSSRARRASRQPSSDDVVYVPRARASSWSVRKVVRRGHRNRDPQAGQRPRGEIQRGGPSDPRWRYL